MIKGVKGVKGVRSVEGVEVSERDYEISEGGIQGAEAAGRFQGHRERR